MEGRVHSINRSAGGVPKLPVESAWLDIEGVEGDGHDDTRFHGGPDRAVCLYSLELIEALAREGHPVGVGTLGENLTIAGVEWSSVTPGALLQIGGVELEVASFTSPCKTIRRSFAGERFRRVSQKVHPGWSRVYARVLEPGIVTIGDAVRVIIRAD
jgi:MOSC domain-containing protein YiiM